MDEFLEKIKNLDESVLKHIKEMNFPYPIMRHISRDKKMSEEIKDLNIYSYLE